jgi:hypothetical protein
MASKGFGKDVEAAIDSVVDAAIEDRAPAAPTVAGLSIADLVAALKAATGNDDETMQRRAQFEAEARKRIEEDDNRTHPGISVYSYPEGDRAAAEVGKIKKLKCEMFWLGYPLEVESLTPAEVDALNLATGGKFPYHKSDGSQETLTVKATDGLNGQLEKIEFTFPCRGDLRHNQPPMLAQLREAFGGPDELTALRAALADAQKRLSAVGA